VRRADRPKGGHSSYRYSCPGMRISAESRQSTLRNRAVIKPGGWSATIGVVKDPARPPQQKTPPPSAAASSDDHTALGIFPSIPPKRTFGCQGDDWISRYFPTRVEVSGGAASATWAERWVMAGPRGLAPTWRVLLSWHKRGSRGDIL